MKPVEHFFEQICHHFWVGATANPLGSTANPPKSDANMLKKVFNWSEVHLSEVTSYKIHTLTSCLDPKKQDFWPKIDILKGNHCTL